MPKKWIWTEVVKSNLFWSWHFLMVHPMLFINYIYAESTDHDREFKKQKKKTTPSRHILLPECCIHLTMKENVVCALNSQKMCKWIFNTLLTGPCLKQVPSKESWRVCVKRKPRVYWKLRNTTKYNELPKGTSGQSEILKLRKAPSTIRRYSKAKNTNQTLFFHIGHEAFVH